MDELTEQNDIAREVAEIMATAVGFTEDDDDVRCTNNFHMASD